MMKKNQIIPQHCDYDLVIIGGGMVGASLACALQYSSLRIAVIEATPFESEKQASFDARSVALSYGSKEIFNGIGLWEKINALGVAPIKKIHVSDRGFPGMTRLDSQQHGVDALGYVVETRILGQVLNETLNTIENVTFLCPAKLLDVTFSPSTAQLSVEIEGQHNTISTRLLVAADGGFSKVRELTHSKVFNHDYQQCAVIANIRMQFAHNNIAYERFTDSGPLAMLPTTSLAINQKAADHTLSNNNCCAMVWTIRAEQQQQMSQLSDAEFIKRFEARFGKRLGRVEQLGERTIYPLSLLRMSKIVQPRVVFIGNAAHTLHPVAGQGFNLGLRDVAALAEVLVDALFNKQDLGNMTVLTQFAKWRQRDHLHATLITDGMVRIFSSQLLPLVVARNIGLVATEIFPPLKRLLIRHAMGMVGKLPRLARQLNL